MGSKKTQRWEGNGDFPARRVAPDQSMTVLAVVVLAVCFTVVACVLALLLGTGRLTAEEFGSTLRDVVVVVVIALVAVNVTAGRAARRWVRSQLDRLTGKDGE